MKITIQESPYGDSGVVYEGVLGMVQHWILQLKSFRNENRTQAEQEHLEADIRGYEQILESGKEDNAKVFLEIKQKGGFPNNEEVVAFLKKNGLWQTL